MGSILGSPYFGKLPSSWCWQYLEETRLASPRRLKAVRLKFPMRTSVAINRKPPARRVRRSFLVRADVRLFRRSWDLQLRFGLGSGSQVLLVFGGNREYYPYKIYSLAYSRRFKSWALGCAC